MKTNSCNKIVAFLFPVAVLCLILWAGYPPPSNAQVGGYGSGGTISTGTVGQVPFYTAATTLGPNSGFMTTQGVAGRLDFRADTLSAALILHYVQNTGTSITQEYDNGASVMYNVIADTTSWRINNGTTTGLTLNASDSSVVLGVSASSPLYKTGTNCSSSASPAVCATAAAGSVVIAAAATTVTVNTTAVTSNSQILVARDDSLGTKLSVTCNTATAMTDIRISARTGGTSFQITVAPAPVTNPYCVSYLVVN